MNSLENWLDDKTSEVRKREEAGFPEDVDAEIKWNKVSPNAQTHQIMRREPCGRSLGQSPA